MSSNRSFLLETCVFLKPALEQTLLILVSNIITCLLDFFVSVTASVGNALVIQVIWKNRVLHSASITLLGCLAMTDLLVGSLVAPLNILTKLGEMVKNENVYCVAGVISSYIGWVSGGLTFLTLTLISVKRYLDIRSITMITSKMILKFMAPMWLGVFVLATLRFRDTKEIFFRPVLMGTTVLCIGMIAFCYGKIFVLCRQYKKEILSNVLVLMNNRENTPVSVKTVNSQTNARKVFMERHKRASLTMFYIILFFFICYLPLFGYQITAATVGTREDDQSMRVVYRFSFSLAMVNSALNPVLYCLRIDDLYMAVTKLISKIAKRSVEGNGT